MEKISYILLFLVIFLGVMYLLRGYLMGYGKGHIVIDFDERYKDYNEYIKAIKDELERKGHEVSYKGNGEFLINGKPYIFIERNVSVGGVPLQRTVLQPKKGYSKKSES